MTQKFVSYLKSQIGQLKITADENSINSILFVFDNTQLENENSNEILEICKKQLNEYFVGERKEFDVNINQEGTEFQQKVWNELVKLPFGKTVSYNYIAERVGGKNMMRAVGSANGKNQISIIVPCHRVIGSDGSLTGYAGGMWRKEWLLKHEDKYSNEERQLGLGF
ncbi:MAG: cysteine methyltransferase [Ignavibacteriales bacterium CG18_big_fil_WC_8_21_14_2_50_31_20]|nr:MAG: cysteine methyltransferase [Ignavibacteriales bacterium CG18_big_fil_WC_8_21_14_2_50_31_20]